MQTHGSRRALSAARGEATNLRPPSDRGGVQRNAHERWRDVGWQQGLEMKVFISSTYVDLVEHRAKVAEAVERLGQQRVMMEVFGARPSEASDASLDEVEASDVFVGIYAHRYLSLIHI